MQDFTGMVYGLLEMVPFRQNFCKILKKKKNAKFKIMHIMYASILNFGGERYLICNMTIIHSWLWQKNIEILIINNL